MANEPVFLRLKISKTVPLILTLVLLFLFASPAIVSGFATYEGKSAATSSSSSQSQSSGIQHVVLIMMENEGYNSIIGSAAAPYINFLAAKYSVATTYPIEVPYSLPNYLAITSGSEDGITADCEPSSCQVAASNIFSLMQGAGLTWKEYAESMPANCYKSDHNVGQADMYVAHHNAPLYYTDLAGSCATKDVPLGDVSSGTGNFFKDLGTNRLPNFSLVTPNRCDDMHTCPSGVNPIAAGDKWLSEFVPSIIGSSEFSNTIVIITWDNGPSLSEPVATIVVGPSDLVNYGHFAERFTHYSTLATIEDVFNLPSLGRNDASATPMTAIVNARNVPNLIFVTTTNGCYCVDVLSPKNDSVIGQIKTCCPAGSPIVYDPATAKVYVLDSASGVISAISPTSLKVTKNSSVELPVKDYQSISLIVVCGMLWATYGRNSIAIIDPQNLSVTGYVELPAGSAISLGYNPANSEVYVGARYHEGAVLAYTVYTVNATSDQVLGNISLGTLADRSSHFGMSAYNPVNNETYVSTLSGVSALSSDNAVLHRFRHGTDFANPSGMAFDSRDGNVYFSAGGSLWVINSTDDVIGHVNLRDSRGVAFNPVDGEVFVAGGSAFDVVVLNGLESATSIYLGSGVVAENVAVS
jgi:DNA-binding beta-propeller fold protein YncE